MITTGHWRDPVLAAFDAQIAWCASLGSPFTAHVLTCLRDNVTADEVTADLVGAWRGDPVPDALPLRLAGALHALVLSDAAPDLAGCYPPGHEGVPENLRSIVRHVFDRHGSFIRDFIALPPQTNEVGRSSVLLGGFLAIAKQFGLPLRMFEIGASAGLNIVWNRYHYRFGGTTWGNPASLVRLTPEWKGPLPPMEAPVRVVERFGCDIAPVDLDDAAQRLRLKAFVWADQHDRLQRLDAAMAIARACGVRVEKAEATDWVEARLEAPVPGCVRVLYHSIMWQYMPESSRAGIAATLKRAGGRATSDAPLAWLRFEPRSLDQPPELRLTVWPSEREQTLAVAQAHGRQVEWSS